MANKLTEEPINAGIIDAVGIIGTRKKQSKRKHRKAVEYYTQAVTNGKIYINDVPEEYRNKVERNYDNQKRQFVNVLSNNEDYLEKFIFASSLAPEIISNGLYNVNQLYKL